MNALRRMVALTAAVAMLCLGTFAASAATSAQDALNGPALSQALTQAVVMPGLPGVALQAISPDSSMDAIAAVPTLFPSTDGQVEVAGLPATQAQARVLRQSRAPPA